MAKGAVLIGCGFKSTQADVENAIEADHIKNCDAVSTTSFDLEVDEKLAYATYIHVTREKLGRSCWSTSDATHYL